MSVGAGAEPRWSRDGRELFYRNGQGQFVSVPVRAQPVFAAGTPSVLFPDADYPRSSVRQQYDVAPDGERFLFIRRVRASEESRLILVQNFFEELERLVPI